jgi:6-phosphogluconate dehydrogenase
MNETSSVVFHFPDFIADGVEYTEIQVIVEMDSDIRDTANLAEMLQRPMKGNANE